MTDLLFLNFGDIFDYLDEAFVFLAESVEKKIMYAGKILNSEKSRKLQQLEKKQQYKANYNPDSNAFSFVVLKTKEFEDRVSWFNHPDTDSTNVRESRSKLDEDDIEAIKKEILDGAFPLELKEKLRQTT